MSYPVEIHILMTPLEIRREHPNLVLNILKETHLDINIFGQKLSLT